MSLEPIRVPAPPIGIVHLFLWVLASSVLLALGKSLGAVGTSEGAGIWATLLYVLDGVIEGAAVSAAGVIAGRRVRGIAIRNAPGHYLLVLVGVTAIAEWLDFVIYKWLATPSSFDQLHFFSIESLILDCIRAAIAFAGLLAVARIWKITFAWQLAAALLYVADQIYRLSPPNAFWGLSPETYSASYWTLFVFQLLACIPLFVATLVDYRCKRGHDWLHWTGVAVWLGKLATSFGWWVAL